MGPPTKILPPRRKNVTTACDTCRESKVKCDANQPQCGNCKIKGKPCVYQYLNDKRKQAISTRKAVEVLGRRIAYLEQFIRSHDLVVPRPPEDDEREIQRMFDTLKVNGETVDSCLGAFSNADFTAAYHNQAPPADTLPPEFLLASPGNINLPDWLMDFPMQPHWNFESILGTENSFNIGPSISSSIQNMPQMEATNSSIESRSWQLMESEYLGDIISSREGALKTFGGSEPRYFGATSNLTLLEGYSGPEERKSALDGLDQGQKAILPAELDLDIDPSIVDYLAGLYFEWQNPSFHVVDKDIFEREVREKKTRVIATRYLTDALVNVICAFGALYSDRMFPDLPSPLCEFFAKRAKIWLDVEIEQPRFTTVQTLSIFSCYEAARGRDGKGWLYSGMAMRLSFDLGLRLDMSESVESGKMTTDEAEARKVAFWGSFIIDHHWALYLGRPPFRLNFDDVSVELPAMHGANGSIPTCSRHGSNATENAMGDQGPCYCEKLIMQQWIKLCQIMSSLNQVLYEMPNVPLDAIQSAVHESVQKLESWKEHLPPILETNLVDHSRSILPHALMLHMQYHHFMIHIYRPFISVANGAMDHRTVRTVCVESAIAISRLIEIYDSHYSLRHMNIEAVSIVFSATIMLVFATVSNVSDGSSMELTEHLNRCSQALVELGATFRNAGRTLDILLTIKRQWQAKLLVSAGAERRSSGSVMSTTPGKRTKLS